MTDNQGPVAGDDAVRDGEGGDGVTSFPVTYERGPRATELHRRAAQIRDGGALAAYPGLAGVDSMTGYPALAELVRANAEAIAAGEARLAGLEQLMRDTIAAAGLGQAAAEEKPRHLKLVRDTEAS